MIFAVKNAISAVAYRSLKKSGLHTGEVLTFSGFYTQFVVELNIPHLNEQLGENAFRLRSENQKIKNVRVQLRSSGDVYYTWADKTRGLLARGKNMA